MAGTNGSKRTIDLDKARTARAEAMGEPVLLKLGGEQFELPPELPAAFALLSERGDLYAALEDLLGEGIEKFWLTKPSMKDIEELGNQIAVAYGIEEGRVGLGRLLADGWEPIEADFQQFYGLDARHIDGCRRLWSLITGLPPEARLWAHKVGEPEKEKDPAIPPPGNVNRTSDPRKIAAFLGRALGR